MQLNDPSLLHEASLLNGEWVAAQSNKRFDIEGEPTTLPDVDKYVETSHAAFERYRHVNPRERAKFLLKWHELITKAREDIATIVVYETGKPMAEALGEVDYALGFAWWFAGEAERVRGSIALPSVSNRRTFVIKQPIGVSAALVPWNFPVAMIVRKVAAALAAGCTMIVKPSPETPLSVMALADLALRAGLAPGVLNVITTDNEYTPSVSERLCKHPLVRKVTFTGSTRVGSIIAKHCSEGLKKVTMELGGNCPFIVFDDGNLEQAVAALMILKWRTAGQACTHANRVYVQAGIYDKFAQMMLEATQKLKVGHGTDSGTTMGPLTTERGVEKLKKLVSDAISKGGKVLCGGKQPNGPQGYFFEPTIISGMTSEMLASQEEIFGPLLGLHRFETEEEAVKMANDTSMGLASYFFTKDIDRTWRLLESLEAGMIGMNTAQSRSYYRGPNPIDIGNASPSFKRIPTRSDQQILHDSSCANQLHLTKFCSRRLDAMSPSRSTRESSKRKLDSTDDDQEKRYVSTTVMTMFYHSIAISQLVDVQSKLSRVITTMQALSGSVSSVLDKPSQVASTDKVEATESPSSRQETPKDIDVDIAADDYPKLDTSTSSATHTILIQNQSSGLDDPVDIMPQTLNQGLARSDNSFPEFNHDILALESLTPHTNSLSHQLPNIWSFEYQMGLQPCEFSRSVFTLEHTADHPVGSLYQQVLMVLSLFNSITRPDVMAWYAKTRFYHIVDLTAWQIYPCTGTLSKVHEQYRPTEVQLQQQYPRVIDWIPFPTIRNRLIRLHAANPQIDQIFCDTVSSYVVEANMADLIMGAPAVTAYIRVTDVIANIPSTTPGSDPQPSAMLPAPDADTLFSSPEYARAVFKKLDIDRGISHYKMDPAFFGTYPELYDPSVDIAAKGIPLRPDVQLRLTYPKPLDSSTFQTYRSFMDFSLYAPLSVAQGFR
ncbi:unnamed protein product [Aspergillus oryzae]|uniref:Unnamed protein product n=1 Tax=Aspergillus oryzae TaxID=5062 RepID=A0AAN4Y9M1_ASPOZ|nr:unnamed protein product [Aspergillus oryzae]